jgi:hypothetical protein
MSDTEHTFSITFDCGLPENEAIELLRHILQQGALNVDGRMIRKVYPGVSQKFDIFVDRQSSCCGHDHSSATKIISDHDKKSRPAFKSRRAGRHQRFQKQSMRNRRWVQ